MKNTKETILDHAQRLVNANGLASLSIRSVAEELAISPGNVSYHFKKKEDLVLALVDRLGGRNRKLLTGEIATLPDLLELYGQIFRGQFQSRGLTVALPDIIETYPAIRQHYRQTERQRRAAIVALLENLRERGELDASDAELERILALHILIARFWIAEARVSYASHSLQELVGHYQALLADTLRPYALGKADAQLAPYLSKIITKAALAS